MVSCPRPNVPGTRRDVTPWMAYKMVTCPETAQLELIEFEDHPLGILTRGCSRFRPACELRCSRSCAVFLDRRDRQPDPQDHELEIDLVIELATE